MSSTRSSFTRTIQTTASTIRLSIPFFLSIFCTILVWFRYVIQTLIEDTKCYRPNSNVIHFDCCNTLKINTNYLHFWEHRWITRNKKKTSFNHLADTFIQQLNFQVKLLDRYAYTHMCNVLTWTQSERKLTHTQNLHFTYVKWLYFLRVSHL